VSALALQPEARTLPRVPGAPRLSAASCELLRTIEIVDDHGDHRLISVPAERALRVIVDDRELVTLTTLGASPELLVLGYLRNQYLVGDVTEIESITVDAESTAAVVKTRAGAHDTAGRIVPTGCGQGTAFGDLLARIDAIKLPQTVDARISQNTLYRLLATMRHHGAVHRAAGSVHSGVLFRGADLMVSVEDVGRHNAIDTITGWMALHGVAGADKIIFTSGRLTSGMVMKAAQGGIPIMVSRNGVSAMGYDIATRLGMTLFGRAANRRFLCYVGAERFDAEPETDRGTARTAAD